MEMRTLFYETFVQMADGSKKKIKEIQLGDNTKGGEVTGVFQFKAADEIHDYKGRQKVWRRLTLCRCRHN